MFNLETIVTAKLEAAKTTNNRQLINIYETLLKEAGLLIEADEVTLSGTVGSAEVLEYDVTFKPRKEAKFVVLGILEEGQTEVVRQSKTYKAAKDAAYSESSSWNCQYRQVFVLDIPTVLVAKAA